MESARVIEISFRQSNYVKPIFNWALQSKTSSNSMHSPQAAAVKAVLETWFKELTSQRDVHSCQESLDFVVVLVDLSFAATDAELLEVLRSLVQAAPNLEDWLMQRGLKESPLAMLAPVVAGYRRGCQEVC